MSEQAHFGTTRRSWISAVLAAAASPAMAAGNDIATKVQGAPDVAVFCDATLAPCLRALGAAFPAPVHVFSAPPPLMLAQIARETQTDVLITLAPAMDEAVRLRLVRPETRYDSWQTQLVLAAPAGSGPTGLSELPDFLASGKLAVTDPTTRRRSTDTR